MRSDQIPGAHREGIVGPFRHRGDETKAFVGSFVKEVVVKPGRAAIVYSIPTPDDSPMGGADAAEIALNGRVMNSVRHGGPGRVRTYDQPVMSRSLCH